MGSTPGPRLASGRWTDVYDAGGGRVVKRYRDPAAAWIADFEARVMTHARAHRVPVPEVFDVDGGDIVLERIPGPTMLHALARHPRAMPDHARTLATLHRAVHEVPAPAGLDEPFGPGGVLLPLFSFNAGVELGQLLVAAVILTLLCKLRTRPLFAARLAAGCSITVGVLGSYWLFERVALN